MEKTSMNAEQHNLLHTTRRHFFRDCRVGLGAMALGSMMTCDGLFAAEQPSDATNPLAPKPPHFKPRAKNVIFLFMAGGPSQLELFDPKPKLQQLEGQVIPESYVENQRFAFIKKDAKLLGTRRKFAQHGESSQTISECLPHLATIADDIAIVRSMSTDVFNHGPAKFFMNTGYNSFGRPSMGAWITYGIGSEANDLPGFVVLQSGPRGPRGGSPNWGSGFLPTRQGSADPEPRQSGRNRRRAARRLHSSGQRFQSAAVGRYERSRNRHAHRGVRDGLPDAIERSRADGHHGRDARDD
jgi:Protein of unknown function (DUF1501)